MTNGASRDPGADEPDTSTSHVFDKGLQHERTALAWDRTGLSLLAVAVLLIRGGGPPYGDLAHAPGYLALGAGAVLLWAGGGRYRRREVDLRQGGSPVRPRLVRLTGVVAVVISLAALRLVLTA